MGAFLVSCHRYKVISHILCALKRQSLPFLLHFTAFSWHSVQFPYCKHFSRRDASIPLKWFRWSKRQHCWKNVQPLLNASGKSQRSGILHDLALCWKVWEYLTKISHNILQWLRVTSIWILWIWWKVYCALLENFPLNLIKYTIFLVLCLFFNSFYLIHFQQHEKRALFSFPYAKARYKFVIH